MKAEEIIERFAASGIKCRESGALTEGPWESVTPVIFDMIGDAAYVIGEDGESVLCVRGPSRIFIPLFECPTDEHVDKLIEATKDEKVLDAVVVVRSDEIMGMCLFV